MSKSHLALDADGNGPLSHSRSRKTNFLGAEMRECSFLRHRPPKIWAEPSHIQIARIGSLHSPSVYSGVQIDAVRVCLSVKSPPPACLSPAPGRRRSRLLISLVQKRSQSSPELRPEESAVVAAAHSQVTHFKHPLYMRPPHSAIISRA